MRTRQCLACGKSFRPRSGRHVTCSEFCKQEQERKLSRERYRLRKAGYTPDQEREAMRSLGGAAGRPWKREKTNGSDIPAAQARMADKWREHCMVPESAQVKLSGQGSKDHGRWESFDKFLTRTGQDQASIADAIGCSLAGGLL